MNSLEGKCHRNSGWRPVMRCGMQWLINHPMHSMSPSPVTFFKAKTGAIFKRYTKYYQNDPFRRLGLESSRLDKDWVRGMRFVKSGFWSSQHLMTAVDVGWLSCADRLSQLKIGRSSCPYPSIHPPSTTLFLPSSNHHRHRHNHHYHQHGII